MNKSALIDKLVEKSQLPRKRVEDAVNALFDSMTKALADGGRVEIRGFGTFVGRLHQARAGRNPRTGAPVAVQAKRTPFFRAGKELKARIDAKP